MALQIAPLIVAERRILISLYLFMAGIILFHLLPSIWHNCEYLNWLLGGSLLVSITGLGRQSMPAIPFTGLWIMPTGMILTISGLFGLDRLVAPLMTARLHALYYLADWIAGFLLAKWKVVPPRYAALFVMVTGMMISQLVTKPMDRICLVLAALGGIIWAFRPVPDGVLFAVGRTPHSVLAANDGTAQSYKLLSNFLSSMAELPMGKSIEPADQTQCLPSCKHDFSNGFSADIVLRAKGLTAACKDLETAFVLTSVTPRNPCCSGKLIYDISQKTGYNYLIFINKNKMRLINNFGSSQQAYPALQPRPC
jgi:hypothetical protein